jgi:hypothetical protein
MGGVAYYSKNTSHYIVLEDLTKGLDAACVCDLKIGRRGHDEQASTKKVLQQKALCAVTTSSSLGFRMCGMRVRTPLFAPPPIQLCLSIHPFICPPPLPPTPAHLWWWWGVGGGCMH